MQIVIDIPNKIYDDLMKRREADVADINAVFFAIAEGTPLPKGHGRLIDEKIAYKKFYSRCLAKVATEVFTETPTIIEADAESEEKNDHRKKKSNQ